MNRTTLTAGIAAVLLSGGAGVALAASGPSAPAATTSSPSATSSQKSPVAK